MSLRCIFEESVSLSWVMILLVSNSLFKSSASSPVSSIVLCNICLQRIQQEDGLSLYALGLVWFFLARNHTMWIWVALCNSQGNSVLLTTSLTSTSELPQTDVWHLTTVWPLFTERTKPFQTFKQNWCSAANLRRISLHFLLVNCQGNWFCRVG